MSDKTPELEIAASSENGVAQISENQVSAPALNIEKLAASEIACPAIWAVRGETEPRGIHMRLRNVNYRAPDGADLLQDIDLEVKPGERVVILGPSGAGKSTLLSVLTGMRIPTRGCVEFDGRCFTKLNTNERRRVRRRIGKIYQDFRLVPQKTAIGNVLNGYLGFLPTWRTIFGFPKECRETARQLLESVGLSDRIYCEARRLSGGEKQRVALARALTQQPGLLLADEPTASLDYQAAQDILQELDRIAERGLTFVAVLHDVELAEVISPRAVLIEKGRIVYDGPSKDLRQTMDDILSWNRLPSSEKEGTKKEGTESLPESVAV